MQGFEFSQMCADIRDIAVYERDFEEYSTPEILRTPLESVVLQLKDLETEGLDDIANIFPFPTPPDREQLAKAEILLKNLGAIGGDGGRITDIGREMMKYPVSARLGKMLVLAKRYNLLPYTMAIVAGLAVDDLFVPEASGDGATGDGTTGDEEGGEDGRSGEVERRHQEYGRAQARLASQSETSDAVKVLTAVCTHAISQNETADRGRQFCLEHWLREKGK